MVAEWVVRLGLMHGTRYVLHHGVLGEPEGPDGNVVLEPVAVEVLEADDVRLQGIVSVIKQHIKKILCAPILS